MILRIKNNKKLERRVKATEKKNVYDVGGLPE